MKKTMSKLPILLGSAMILALPSVASAVAGKCSNCHTMHNSEQGSPVAQVFQGLGDIATSITPLPVLLKGDCYGCHAQGTSNRIEVTFGGGGEMPQVYHDDPDADLAAGNFAYITGDKGTGASDRKGHNVADLVGADTTLHGPPGWSRGPAADQTYNTEHHTDLFVPNFSCAGKFGCHGQRQSALVAGSAYGNGSFIPGSSVMNQGITAMKGAHHANATGQILPEDATTIGSSYRFLFMTAGFEDSDWENDAADHNEYYGQDGMDGYSSSCGACHIGGHSAGGDVGDNVNIANSTNTMSGLCETCHANFHSSSKVNVADLGSKGPIGAAAASGGEAFLRHPTDYALPTTGEYSNYFGTDKFNLTALVARQAVPTASSNDVNVGDTVMCLSCHMAHASDNAAMLRFDYDDMIADGGANGDTGCFVCHNTKF